LGSALDEAAAEHARVRMHLTTRRAVLAAARATPQERLGVGWRAALAPVGLAAAVYVAAAMLRTQPPPEATPALEPSVLAPAPHETAPAEEEPTIARSPLVAAIEPATIVPAFPSTGFGTLPSQPIRFPAAATASLPSARPSLSIPGRMRLP